MSLADDYMDGYFTGMLIGYLSARGLTDEEAEAQIALGVCSEYERVQLVAADPADAARWSAQARHHRETGGPF
jgi:TPR repeat protein